MPKSNDPPEDELSNEMSIAMFLNCGLCVEEFKARIPATVDESPATYARLNVGWTKEGLQVWCVRHNCNVMHLDFEGQKHPANMTRKPLPN